jgi:hypothetical protein
MDNVNKRPEPQFGRCPHCGTSLPNPWTSECRHRRACEARQMLQAGASSADAARHAQRLPPLRRTER